MIKNVPRNQLEKYKNLILEVFFSSTAFLLRLNAVWKILGFHKGFNRLFDTDCETIMRGPWCV